MQNKKIKKNPILSILSGPMNFTCFKEAPYIAFKNPDGTLSKENTLVWKLEDIKKFLKDNMSEFRKNIFAPADSFIQAVKMSQHSIAHAFNKEPDYMFANLKHTAGIMISDDITIFFKINKEEYLFTAVCFVDDILASGFYEVALHKTSLDKSRYRAYVPIQLSQSNKEDVETIQQMRAKIDSTFIITAFRNYADHELKIVAGKSTSKLNNITYNNLNKQSMQIIDSSWYTTITRTEGFLVKGHLRMQPCGPNMSERKLIYIDSFEKHGYTRKAKMLPRDNASISTITETLYS